MTDGISFEDLDKTVETVANVDFTLVGDQWLAIAAFLGAFLAASMRTFVPFWIMTRQTNQDGTPKRTWNDFKGRFFGTGLLSAFAGMFTAIQAAPEAAGYFLMFAYAYVSAYVANSTINKPG